MWKIGTRYTKQVWPLHQVNSGFSALKRDTLSIRWSGYWIHEDKISFLFYHLFQETRKRTRWEGKCNMTLQYWEGHSVHPPKDPKYEHPKMKNQSMGRTFKSLHPDKEKRHRNDKWRLCQYQGTCQSTDTKPRPHIIIVYFYGRKRTRRAFFILPKIHLRKLYIDLWILTKKIWA